MCRIIASMFGVVYASMLAWHGPDVDPICINIHNNAIEGLNLGVPFNIVPSMIIIEDIRKHMGAQWLSGRVLDSRPKDREFEPHRRHCVVSLSKNIYPSLLV